MNWNEQVVLITGGTGSFGRKFVEVMLEECRPQKLIIFSRDELKQHEMRTQGFDQPSLRYFLGDVRDEARLRRAMHGVSVVVHAAALKQVPACEYNPFEAIQTNIMGARNVVEAALDMGVSRVMALSTDKAVNPVNLYGATKLAAEKLLVQSNAYAGGNGNPLRLRALRQRHRKPGQRDTGVPAPAGEWRRHHHRRSDDALLDLDRPGRALHHPLHRTDAGRRSLRAQDPQHEGGGPGQRDRAGL